MDVCSSTRGVYARLVPMRFLEATMEHSKSFDFISFVKSNEGHPLSSLDYLHAVYKASELHEDFIFYIAKMFRPDFKILEGNVYVSELFDSERYNEMLGEKMGPDDVQFWMNLLEITGLFDNLSVTTAKFFADVLATSWNTKMATDFGHILKPARVICNDGEGEVFITIGEPSSD